MQSLPVIDQVSSPSRLVPTAPPSRGEAARLLFAALLLIVAAAVLSASAAADEPDRPNIVLIMVDDMGYSDLGSFGAVEIETPRLDELADQGLRFTQFYNNAKCQETRASLLTGLWWHETNYLRNMRNQATLPELLRDAGYSTLMVGKWHLGNWQRGEATPLDRGFDRYFGFLNGAIDFFTGEQWGGERYMFLDDQPYDPPDDFYSTDAFTDYAISFIDEAREEQPEQPFFLYLAHNAPHFPLHAPAEDIEKYRGRFMMGWDALRRRRYARMQELGLIDPSIAQLSERDAVVPPWDELSEQDKRAQDLLMATYAAMMDRLDRNVGRLLDHLEEQGLADDTIVLFLSDNGACPYEFDRTPDQPPGPAGSYRTYNSPWANASNTPLRLYKQWAHEGGAATPLLVRWPGVVDAGGLTRETGHIVDLMPTLLEAAGVEYPDEFDERELAELPGASLLPLWRGRSVNAERPLFWEFRGHHGVRQGPWKLVAERGRDWELYHVPSDRAEVDNQLDQEPEIADRLAELYDQWAQRVGAPAHDDLRQRSEVNQAR